jgi:hypothetical protein
VHTRTSACDDNDLHAFDKTVRRKRLAFAADAVDGNSIDLELEVIAKKGVARKAWLLMLVNVLLPAFTPVMVRRGCSSFKRRYACPYKRGSVRRASGFVCAGHAQQLGGVSPSTQPDGGEGLAKRNDAVASPIAIVTPDTSPSDDSPRKLPTKRLLRPCLLLVRYAKRKRKLPSFAAFKPWRSN